MSWLDQLAEIRQTDWTQASETERDSKSREVIRISGYAGAAASVVPVPMAELALLLPIHTAMVMTVGHVQGRTLSRAEAARVAMELGAVAGLTFAGTAALSALRKLVMPGIGGVLAAPASFALTWGLGRVALEYFKDPALSREELRTVFSDAFKEGKESFSKERFDRFRRKHGEGKTVVDEADQKTPPEPEMAHGDPEPSGQGAQPVGASDRSGEAEHRSTRERPPAPEPAADRGSRPTEGGTAPASGSRPTEGETAPAWGSRPTEGGTAPVSGSRPTEGETPPASGSRDGEERDDLRPPKRKL
jgi:uncharacterized protein (DUF697 family)